MVKDSFSETTFGATHARITPLVDSDQSSDDSDPPPPLLDQSGTDSDMPSLVSISDDSDSDLDEKSGPFFTQLSLKSPEAIRAMINSQKPRHVPRAPVKAVRSEPLSLKGTKKTARVLFGDEALLRNISLYMRIPSPRSPSPRSPSP